MSYNNFNNQQGNQYGNQQGINKGQADDNFNIGVNFSQAQQIDINSQTIKAGTYTFTITDIKQRTSQKGVNYLNMTCENKDGNKVFYSLFPEQTDKFFSFVQMINPTIDARTLQAVNKVHFIGKVFNGVVELESYVHDGNERTKGVIRKIEQFQGQEVYVVSEVQTVTTKSQQNNSGFNANQFSKNSFKQSTQVPQSQPQQAGQHSEQYYRYPQSATHDQMQQMNAQRAPQPQVRPGMQQAIEQSNAIQPQQYQQPQMGQFQQGPMQAMDISDDDLPF
ncbi:MAG: hypothetical protein ACRC6H_03310 [Culicoidibacterales bacterium]